MKLSLIAGALALALSTAACNTTGVTGGSVATTSGATTITVESTKLSQLVAKAQTYAKVACGILPAASSIAALFSAADGAIGTAEALAQAACSALTSQTAYAADDGQPAAPKPPKKGEKLSGEVVINGRVVPVQGTVIDPKKAAAPAR